MVDRQYKIDLHTHSSISPDGGIGRDQYTTLLKKGDLDCLAITDHNTTEFARELQDTLGEKIIVGEEITTIDGEMIGLFLKKTIRSGKTAQQTADEIHNQGGLAYIPHPFETLRQGIQLFVLEKMIHEIDILEVFNGRGKWRGKSNAAHVFAAKHDFAQAASSDAHGIKGIGKTFSLVQQMPTQQSLKQLLRKGTLQEEYAPLWTFLYPTINRIKNKIC